MIFADGNFVAATPILHTDSVLPCVLFLQDLPNVGDVSVTYDPFTLTRIADAKVTIARDASSAVVTSSRGLRGYLSPGDIVRIGGDDAFADGTLAGTNGERYLDYPGGAGHR